MKLLRGWLSTYFGWWVTIVSKRPVVWAVAIGALLLGGMMAFEGLHLPLWIAIGIWVAVTPGFFAALSVISSGIEDSRTGKPPNAKKPPRKGRKGGK